MSLFQVTENTFRSARNSTFYLASGPSEGTPIVFVHGWPELALDLHAYASAYERTSFFGTDSLYMNHAANARYASEALNDGYLDMPVLFLEAEYDYTCDCVNSPLAEPMNKLCRDLTIERIQSGHWVAQEKPVEVNARLAQWLGARIPQAWGG